jgi:hypothetical protein
MSQKRLVIVAILLACAVLTTCKPAAAPAALQTPVPATPALPTTLAGQPLPGVNIVDLVESAAITYTLTSGSINQLGLDLTNSSDQAVHVAIPAGTYFVNADPQSQNMIVVRAAELLLQPGEQSQVVVDVVCANLHLAEPTQENTFTIQRQPSPPVLTDLIDRLNAPGIEYPVQQAAVWIMTDDATFDELGVLVKDSRFGQSVITEQDALWAMKLLDESGIDLREHAIWADFNQLLFKARDPHRMLSSELVAWAGDQQATQTVLDETQAVLDATRAVKRATEAAAMETQFATENAPQETQFALEETQWAATETAQWPVETPLATVAVAAGGPGELAQFAAQASASSQYDSSSWSALQATGAPNTAECGDFSSAWASRSSVGVDWLLLTFDQAVIPARIVVYESYNPGAITRVEVLDENDSPTVIYTSESTRYGECPKQLVIEVNNVSVPVKSVRLTLDHSAWSEIDAVQLIGAPAN